MKTIDKIILDSGYYIDFMEIKNTMIFTYPKNTKLNLEEYSIFYTKKPYGLLITDYIKKRIECPEYAVTPIIFSDFLFQSQARQISTKLLYKNNSLFSLESIKIGGDLEYRLLNTILNFLVNEDHGIEEDILEGYNAVINFINGKIC
jgi:hypothetical protein